MKEGIRKTSDGYQVNFDKEDIDDIISFDISLYESTIKDHVYQFGYKFNDNVNSKTRSNFVQWIKGLLPDKPTPEVLRALIERPLSELHKRYNLSTFDCSVSPKSGRSELVNYIIKIKNEFLQHGAEKVSIDFVKSIPSKVHFDWKSFNDEYTGEIGDNRYKQIKEYVDNMLDKIHRNEYFSIARYVKPKYRPYIMDYLEIPDNSKSIVEADRILLIDDINTTGATINEILRIVGTFNSACEVFIFTLIGR